ncbi:GTP 3',8-cyclase MoaA [Consotaella salsifontis]|uniref:GTP 3',8-cyclase n=1 Tax=Consotaella salsifontis TaxID=1365950 RepID=A0A1T4NY98_9HYPH|nr:GTP 3',8-cyclase MoaA [Consotaella salsifontis]SJZ84244.1 cyclic pyranopterin monophosphate synthase subunit MoaA [Consotaella salsifontis]
MTCSLIDRFGRHVTYLRVSVTDRCDLRCVYCMCEHMTFVPHKELLSLEELDRLATMFIERGVNKLRLTGGEPLVRKGIMSLIQSLSRHLKSGRLNELTLTTNGTLLSRYAEDLAQAGIKRINISLDTLDADRYRALTRRGSFSNVMDGLKAAKDAGLKIKLNAVALKDSTPEEVDDMIAFAHGQGMDLTFIETMPLGEIEADRADQYLPLTDLVQTIEKRWSLTPLPDRTGGPARYMRVAETGGRIGLITPLTSCFCEGCNRVRLSCTGELYTCLGQEGWVDLKSVLRNSESDGPVMAAIDRAIGEKPEGHDFVIDRDGQPALARHMSALGG